MNSSIVLVARLLQLRRRWHAVVVLTLFVGVVGGLSISLGRRCTTISHSRGPVFGATIPYDLQLGAQSLGPR